MNKREISVAKTTAALVNWDDPKMQTQIKEMYGKTLNEQEWGLFLGLGRATKLNPFLREIWAVKYGNAASIFIGRDGYRRSAQNHPDYEYHMADAVYANDVFKMTNGQLTHEYNLKDRGALIGAYCLVKRKSASIPAMNFVELKEYVQKFGVWTTKPATMIKKVVEAQGLRGSFQELFAGTYEESESWSDNKDPEKSDVSHVDVQANKVLEPNNTHGLEVIDIPTEKPPHTFEDMGKQLAEDEIPAGKIRQDQTRKLFAVWGKYKEAAQISEEDANRARKDLMRSMFSVETSTRLTERQADELVAEIERMTKEALS